jgi:hypothetical protein
MLTLWDQMLCHATDDNLSADLVINASAVWENLRGNVSHSELNVAIWNVGIYCIDSVRPVSLKEDPLEMEYSHPFPSDNNGFPLHVSNPSIWGLLKIYKSLECV